MRSSFHPHRADGAAKTAGFRRRLLIARHSCSDVAIVHLIKHVHRLDLEEAKADLRMRQSVGVTWISMALLRHDSCSTRGSAAAVS